MESCHVKFLENKRGQRLCCRYWWLDAGVSAKALVFISHGLAEHLGLYERLASVLRANAVLAFGHDHVGHGRSDGRHVHIEHVDDLVDDLVMHVSLMRHEFPTLPVFVLGHSMGGMVALRAALQQQSRLADGIILASAFIVAFRTFPLIGDLRLSPLRLNLLNLALNTLGLVRPDAVIGSLAVTDITRDEQMAQMLVNDELFWGGGLDITTILALAEALHENQNLLSELNLPVLLMHGADDRICNALGSELLHQECGSEDKDLEVVRGAVHHLFLDLPEVRRHCTQRVVEWIAVRSSKKTDVQQ